MIYCYQCSGDCPNHKQLCDVTRLLSQSQLRGPRLSQQMWRKNHNKRDVCFGIWCKVLWNCLWLWFYHPVKNWHHHKRDILFLSFLFQISLFFNHNHLKLEKIYSNFNVSYYINLYISEQMIKDGKSIILRIFVKTKLLLERDFIICLNCGSAF